MLSDTICKTISQYNLIPIPKENMEKLQEIAYDYNKVKNYVYQRYGGIKSLSKLYPGYTIQNEMTCSGLRENLNLPSVYFYLAVFDALGDIKNQWTKTKNDILQKINKNESLSEEEKHYLRFILKINNALEDVLNHRNVQLKKELQEQYELLEKAVDKKRLNNYLCRKVRKFHVKIKTGKADGFSLTERAYRYGDHGIYITMKEKRKRIFIALTDGNQYKRQLYIKLYPEEERIEIKVPVNVKVQNHQNYIGQIGIAMGIYTMLVTDEGHIYGERLGEYHLKLADWTRLQAKRYHPNNEEETGRKKYTAQKKRMTEQLHNYINMELNRFIKTEQPGIIYIPKLPRPQKHGGNKAINNSVNMWQRGYIRKRLRQKCMEHSIEIVEVFGKNISKECSRCGVIGLKYEEMFICGKCGYRTNIKKNTAENAKKRGKQTGS